MSLSSQVHNVIKNIMSHGPLCYIPKFMEIEPLVPRDKMFKVFSSPVQSTGRAIVLALASALALALTLALALPFPSRHF